MITLRRSGGSLAGRDIGGVSCIDSSAGLPRFPLGLLLRFARSGCSCEDETYSLICAGVSVVRVEAPLAGERAAPGAISLRCIHPPRSLDRPLTHRLWRR